MQGHKGVHVQVQFVECHFLPSPSAEGMNIVHYRLFMDAEGMNIVHYRLFMDCYITMYIIIIPPQCNFI